MNKVLIAIAILSFSQTAVSQISEESCDCNGTSGNIWTNQNNSYSSSWTRGGCVSKGSRIGSNVYIAETAKVCGANTVKGQNVELTGNALVTDQARIVGKNISIGGGAIIGGQTRIGNDVEVTNFSLTDGKSHTNEIINGTPNQDYVADQSKELEFKKIKARVVKLANKLSSSIPEPDRKDNATFIENYSMYFKSQCVLSIDTTRRVEDDYTNRKLSYTEDVTVDFANNKVTEQKFVYESHNKKPIIIETSFTFQNEIGMFHGLISRNIGNDEVSTFTIMGNYDLDYDAITEINGGLKAIAKYCWAL